MSAVIPNRQTKRYRTSQAGDLFGDIVRSRNLDFNKKGYLSLAPKPYVFYTEGDDADFDIIVCIVSDESNIYAITTDHAFSFSFTSTTVSSSELTGGSPPTFGFQSDAVFYQGTLHASGTTTVRNYSAGSWTSRITGLSSSYPHPLCVSEHQQYLAVGNGNTVALYNGSYSLVTTCTVPNDQIVEWIRWRNNQLYFGTRNINGGSARLYLWGGSGTAADRGFGYPCDWLYSGCEFDNSMVVVASTGEILRFNGGGFSPLAEFPVYYSGRAWTSSASTSNLMGKIASRGMIAKGRRLYFNVDGETNDAANGMSENLPSFPSGLWVYDLDVGLYHKAGYGNKNYATIDISSTTTDTITLASAADFETSDPVLVRISGVTGLQSGRIYFAVKVSSTQLRLAYTPAEAVAGTYVSGIGGTPGASDELTFNTYRSVGATHCQRSGGIDIITRILPSIFMAREVVYGGEVYDNAAAAKTVIQSLGMGKNVGSITTGKIQANQVKDMFSRIVSKFPRFNMATQKIIIKYRVVDKFCIPVGGAASSSGLCTWASTTSFTIDPDAYECANIAVGYEIEFTEGVAAGYTAHITAITPGDPYTFTIDEAMPDVVASDRSDLIVDNWTKFKTVSTADDAQAAAEGIVDEVMGDDPQKWIQFRFELRGWNGPSWSTTDLEEIFVGTDDDQFYE